MGLSFEYLINWLTLMRWAERVRQLFSLMEFENANLRISSVQSLSCVQLFGTPWTAARQASLFITNSRSLPKLMSIESLMPSNHLILCCPLLLLPSIFPNIRVFSNESCLIRWPKNWSFSFSISPSNEYSGLISFRMDWLNLLAVQGTLKSLLEIRKVYLLWKKCKLLRVVASLGNVFLRAAMETYVA